MAEDVEAKIVQWSTVVEALKPLLTKSEGLLNEVAKVAAKFISTEANPIVDETGAKITISRVTELAAASGVSRAALYDKLTEKVFGSSRPAVDPKTKTAVESLGGKLKRALRLEDEVGDEFSELSDEEKAQFHTEYSFELESLASGSAALLEDAEVYRVREPIRV